MSRPDPLRVLRWTAAEVAELLDTSVASVNSALQRARSKLAAGGVRAEPPRPLAEADRELLARYVEAFERYDMEALTSLIHEDATRSMPRRSRDARPRRAGRRRDRAGHGPGRDS